MPQLDINSSKKDSNNDLNAQLSVEGYSLLKSDYLAKLENLDLESLEAIKIVYQLMDRDAQQKNRDDIKDEDRRLNAHEAEMKKVFANYASGNKPAATLEQMLFKGILDKVSAALSAAIAKIAGVQTQLQTLAQQKQQISQRWIDANKAHLAAIIAKGVVLKGADGKALPKAVSDAIFAEVILKAKSPVELMDVIYASHEEFEMAKPEAERRERPTVDTMAGVASVVSAMAAIFAIRNLDPAHTLKELILIAENNREALLELTITTLKRALYVSVVENRSDTNDLTMLLEIYEAEFANLQERKRLSERDFGVKQSAETMNSSRTENSQDVPQTTIPRNRG